MSIDFEDSSLLVYNGNEWATIAAPSTPSISHEELERMTQVFLAKGGRIQICDPGDSGEPEKIPDFNYRLTTGVLSNPELMEQHLTIRREKKARGKLPHQMGALARKTLAQRLQP